ncbi:hypothetical protein [Cohnella sp. 56]|uniref:hypothetical protein n=1 Tax=Cohnella sp. 56 TaxID=3113722 RepID=UPI0030E9EA9A
MDPWVTLVIAGAAIAGYGWLKPEPKEQKQSFVNEEAYDKLLEDLETENRELVDAVAVFKREQDETVGRLGRRIRELERQMDEGGRRPALHAVAGAAEAQPGRPAPGAAAASAPPRPAASPDDVRAPAHRADAASTPPASPHAPPPAPLAAEQDAGQPEGEGAEAPLSIRERYRPLVDLYERGRSVEQVAKAMNMNKGEVQLILQLAKREANRHE